MLEPYEGKLSCTVLRGESGSNTADLLDKPSDFTQREGRILRQGNTFPEVRILNYVTEGTLDSYLYQVVTDKARFIAQLLDDKCPARVSEDCDEKVLTFAELQAAAEGNPDFKTRIELSNKIAELLALQQAHQHEQGKMQQRVDQIPGEIERLKTQITQMQEDQKSAAKMKDAEGKIKAFDFVTPMRTIRRHEDINAYLHQQITKRIERPFDEMPKFRIGDFTVSVELRPGEMDEAMLAVKGQREPSYSIPLGKGNSPFYEKDVEPLAVHMSGQETFKFAVKQIVGDIKLICEQAGISPEQIDYIVPHQANIRIIDLAARRLGVPMEKFIVNIEKIGNTSSASVPISFDGLVRSGRLKKGDLIVLCAFGGGLSSGACLLRW